MDEVLAVLSKSTLSLRSDDDMSSWLEAADKDGDGKLDFSEFVRLYNKA
jgi:Ca2+-binding EF-hand superfamily protein